MVLLDKPFILINLSIGVSYNQVKEKDVMTISKEAKSFDMPWEKEYGYAQAIKVEDTIYVSGQVSHDDKGNIVGRGDMETQMRQAYENIQKLLTQYGATLKNVVDEVLFVTDMDASTIIQIQRLAFPELMIEIKCVAKI